jgi:transcriptional regulator with XRE-family HTH domain
MNIGLAIRSIRRKLGVSQHDLAEKCQLTQTALSQIETGKKRPSQRTMDRICEALDIPQSIIYIVAMEDTDVSPGKKDVYDLVYPSIKTLALQMIDFEHRSLIPTTPEEM